MLLKCMSACHDVKAQTGFVSLRMSSASGPHISVSYMHSGMEGGAMLENQSLRA